VPEEGKKRSHPESGLVPGASRGERGPIAGGAFGGSNRALLERVSDMVTVSDREGRIVYANPATERVSGYSPEEFAALHPFDSMHPEDRPRCEEAFEKLRNTPGLSLDLEHRFRHKDGSWRWAQGTFEGLFDDPEIGGLVATVRDVTEKKRAEAGLRDSEAKSWRRRGSTPAPAS
jgi:PAS domain S-box-containing protein